MPLPLVLGAAKALKAVKALKAAKALKATKSMKAAGSAAKGAKAAGGPKQLMTKGFNNVGSKENLKASKNKLKQQSKTDRLLKRDERRTNFKDKVGEIKKNMEARSKEQEQQSSGESKKKESAEDLYKKSMSALERKDRRSSAMDKFATKGKMKHGGKYEDGGRKGPLKKVKAAIRKANNKAGAVKNRLEKKVTDAIKRKKAEKAEKAPMAGKGMKYKSGGKVGDPVKKSIKKIEAANAADKSAAGLARQSSLKSKNATQAIIERSKGYGPGGVSKLIAKKKLAPQTMIPKGALPEGTRMAKDFRERDPKTGMSPKSKGYQVKNKGKVKALKNKSLKK